MQVEKTLKGESVKRKTPPPKLPRLKNNVEENFARSATISQAVPVAANAPTAHTRKQATFLRSNASVKLQTKAKKHLHFRNPLEKQNHQRSPRRDSVANSALTSTLSSERKGDKNVAGSVIKNKSGVKISAGNQALELRESKSIHKNQLAYGCTSLMYACQTGDAVEVLEQLRSKPERLRQRDSRNKSALHYCAVQCEQKRDLVAAASIATAAPELLESADEDGFTPLHLAVIQGNLAMVNLLLANKADVNAVDKEGHSVVHWATVCGEVEALRLVLSAGANVAIPDINGGSPLHYAAQMCGASYDNNLCHGNSTKLALEILGVLLAHPQTNIDVQDKDGRPPLLWAASAGSAKAIIALVKAGARVESSDKDGLTALHCAASRGHTECIDTLISLCGAPTDLIDTNGCTALHYAVTLGHADATAKLLDLEADPNRQDRKGRTPAHCGCSKGQFETIKLLKGRGANLWLRNAKGDLPVHEAAASGRRELVAWLLDQRPNQVNTTSNDGRSLLHIASANDYTDICKFLLDSGADMNAVYRNSKGVTNTPLDCAIQRGHRSTAKFLQANGGLPASKLRLTARRANPFHEATTDMVRPLKYVEKEEIHDLRNSKKYVVYLKRSDSDGRGEDGSCSCTERTYKREQRVAHKCKMHRQPSLRRRTSSCGEAKELAYTEEGSDICRSKSNIEISRRKAKQRYASSSDWEHDEADEDSCENCCYHKRQKQRVIQRKRVNSMKRSTDKLHSDGEQKLSIFDKDATTEKREDRYIEAEINKEKVAEVAQYKALSQELRPSSKSSTRSRPQSATKRQTPPSSAAKEATFIKSPPASAAKKREISKEKISTAKAEASDDKMSTHALELTDEDDQVLKGVETVITQVDVHHEADEPRQHESQQNGSKQVDYKQDDFKQDIQQQDEKQEDGKLDEEKKQDDTLTTTADEKAEDDMIETLTKQASKEIEQVLKVAATAIASECKNSEGNIEQSEKENAKSTVEEISDSKLDENINNNVPSINENQTSKTTVETEKETVSPTTKTMVTPATPRPDESTTTDGPKDETPTKPTPQARVSISEAKDTPEADAPAKKPQETSSDDTQKLREKESRRSFTLLPSDSADEEQPEQTERKSSFQILKSDESVGDVDAIHSELSDMQVFRIITSHSSADGQLKTAHYDEEFEEDADRRTSTSPFKHFQNTQNRHGIGNIEAAGGAYGMYDNMNGRKRRLKRRVKSGGTKARTSWKGTFEAETLQQISTKDQDSGFEPSPRASKTKIPAPRNIYTAHTPRRTLYATLDGRTCSSRLENRKPGDRGACDMMAVTRSIQRNIRRYYMERKIFQHLLELKSLQIRSNKLNEAVLVKRAVDDYHKSCSVLGGETGTRLRRYSFSEYSFKNFELFLYETLKALQKPGTYNFQNINEVYEEAERRLSPDYNAYEKALHCTTKTHRCPHAIHAYTGIPCAAYIPMINHHTMPKLGFGSYKKTGVGSFYLPKILTKSNSCGVGGAGGGGSGGLSCTGKMALELTHGKSKQLISLPSDKLDSNKRYYVTFTVKESSASGGGIVSGCGTAGIARQSTADKQQNDGNEATGK